MLWRAGRTCYALVILLSAAPRGVAGQHILIVHDSRTGHTALMADAVAQGARTVDGAEVRSVAVDSVSPDDFAWCDALIVGSPVHAGNVSASTLAFLETLPFDGGMRDKVGAAFVTAGGISAGEEAAQLAILRAMLVYNMIVVGGPEWTEAFGASAVTMESPFGDPASPEAVAPMFLEKGSKLGARVAEVARLLHPHGAAR